MPDKQSQHSDSWTSSALVGGMVFVPGLATVVTAIHGFLQGLVGQLLRFGHFGYFLAGLKVLGQREDSATGCWPVLPSPAAAEKDDYSPHDGTDISWTSK